MLRDKVYIVGPPSSGKTTFSHKMMGRDFLLFSNNIVETTDIPESLDDAVQVFMILPSKEELEERGGQLSDQELDKYMEFYHSNMNNDFKIVWVTDF